MKKKYRIILCFICALLLTVSLCGCSSEHGDKSDGLTIVTTLFPEYDWVRNIIGKDNGSISLSMLLESGIDLHSYQPSAKDIVRISTCDMFIYVGGESDRWVKDALKEARNKEMTVISLLDILGDYAKEEEIPNGAESGHEEEEEEEETEYDEHVWLSLKNASVICKRICEKICELDEKNKEKYEANTKKYIESLNALDNEYKNSISSSENRSLVFGDRFPFRYLADDYGLDCYAAFSGCSAETEASFKTVINLAGKIDELGLKTILKIETSDGSVANSIKNATKSKDQAIVTIDSMQSINASKAADADYLSIMRSDLEIIRSALKK